MAGRASTRGDGTRAGRQQLLASSSTWLDEPVTVSRLALRYALTGLVTLMVVAVVTAYASRRLGTDEAIREANTNTALAAGVAVEPVLDDGLLTGDPHSLAVVDHVVRNVILKDPLVRVKIWSPDGTILYSDESRLIGDHFTLDPAEVTALRTGRSRAQVSDLSEPENRFEEPATQLLEVYLPVRTTQGTKLLFEAYYRYQGVAEQGRRIWLRFAPFSLGALLLLELLQVPLALSLARRLRRTQAQREGLLRQAIDSTDVERRRIASDLHDGVVQDLAGVAFSLGGIARRSTANRADTADVRESAERVRDAVRSLRSLLVEIYPANLSEEGIEGALSDLMVRLEPRGITSTLTTDGPVASLDVEASQLIYRAAQEALRNVVTHADATRVDVSLVRNEVGTVLEITDDGRGFDGVPEREGHLGLKALSGLAASMGASVSVESVAGKGTTMRLEVPNQ
jgi:two-component system, NarL family, sensor kinase